MQKLKGIDMGITSLQIDIGTKRADSLQEDKLGLTLAESLFKISNLFPKIDEVSLVNLPIHPKNDGLQIQQGVFRFCIDRQRFIQPGSRCRCRSFCHGHFFRFGCFLRTAELFFKFFKHFDVFY